MTDEEYNKRIEKINEYGKKWLEYMNKVDISDVRFCPNGHLLVAYVVSAISSDIVIACNNGGIGIAVDICDYYDYNNFKVPDGTQLSINIERR